MEGAMRLPIPILASLTGLWIVAPQARPSEADALAISANIRARHMPFGTILDPIFTTSASDQITGYTHCGDSALWTGAYLAAEAFRYNVTQSSDALDNVKAALAGLKALADVTGDNRLARCMVAANSPYAAGIANEEANNTVHQNPPWIWLDNTSRDEVVGAFFGLGSAYDLVDDATVRAGIGALAARLMGFISDHQWSPNDDISNTFLLRPEELQMLLQVTRHVNSSDTVSGPFFVPPTISAVVVDIVDNGSYFKFNLDYLTFYNLLRLQNNSDNVSAYHIVRAHTAAHQNAFFDIIDRALQGPNARRDAEMRSLLDQWLVRPKRDFYVDLTKTVQICGSEACQPVPVPLRPPTDFLWQRDPFQLTGGAKGLVENAGVDYILPYWMARYYGVIPGATVESAAAPTPIVAPGSLATLYGADLAPGIAPATTQPLPTLLGGATLAVTDAAGVTRNAALLYVSPAQINFVVPEGAAPGQTSLVATNGSITQTSAVAIQPVAPTLFSANGTGSGVAAATGVFTLAANPAAQSPVLVYQCTGSACATVPIQLGVDTDVYVSFYGTGIRHISSLANASVTIGGVSVPVLYAGPSPGFAGLDQVNVRLIPSLRGIKETGVVLTVDGQASNTVTINIQ
jgi:uncharacterized protein (TIGR03437 family)